MFSRAALRASRAAPLRARAPASFALAARSVTTDAASASLNQSVPKVRVLNALDFPALGSCQMIVVEGMIAAGSIGWGNALQELPLTDDPSDVVRR